MILSYHTLKRQACHETSTAQSAQKLTSLSAWLTEYNFLVADVVTAASGLDGNVASRAAAQPRLLELPQKRERERPREGGSYTTSYLNLDPQQRIKTAISFLFVSDFNTQYSMNLCLLVIVLIYANS